MSPGAGKNIIKVQCIYGVYLWNAKCNTLEPVLKNHPMSHINVFSQDRWSLVTGSITMKYRTFRQEYLVFQDSGLSIQVSLYVVVGCGGGNSSRLVPYFLANICTHSIYATVRLRHFGKEKSLLFCTRPKKSKSSLSRTVIRITVTQVSSAQLSAASCDVSWHASADCCSISATAHLIIHSPFSNPNCIGIAKSKFIHFMNEGKCNPLSSKSIATMRHMITMLFKK